MRLAQATLSRLPGSVAVPRYRRAGLPTGIVHLGLGAFHRAHQARYTDALLSQDPGWGILGVSLRSPDTEAALAPQDFLYTLAERDAAGERLTVIGALTGAAVAPRDPAAVIARMSLPEVRIVTLTITEKGYCRAATGELDESHPGIRHDLASPAQPKTALGLLAGALAARRAAGTPPFTLLSCDNLPANGRTLRGLLVRFAALRDPGFARWIEDNASFPDCMVDRIVPATTAEDRAHISAALGLEDAWPVVAEPFTQWVIEDRFPTGRPEWERAGAELVTDVRPYEEMKLRLLNGCHSSIAYLGQLAGWETVADAMANQALARFAAALMEEAAATLAMPPATDIAAYQRALLERFRNPALRHRTAQIAMDGSQKLPQRLLATARLRHARGQPARNVALGVAAWLRFLKGGSDAGAPLQLTDPMADRLRLAAETADDPTQLAAAVFALSGLIPADLAASPAFRAEVEEALRLLLARGAAATLAVWR
jgi:fructuronate reductase